MNETTGVAVFEQRGLKDQEPIAAIIKEQAAALWDTLDTITTGTPEGARLLSIAKTNLETSVMFAVKALSRNY